MKAEQGISRRGFLRGTAAAGALAALGAAGCAPAQQKEEAALAKEAADGRHSWEVAPSPVTEFVEEIDADVVIIGAGMAGCTAAQAAAEAGASVVVIEQFEQITAHGEDIGAIGTKLQA